MVRLTLIAVGFVVATAGVIALARASTARWERDKRAPIAARSDASARGTPRAGHSGRLTGPETRRRVATLRSKASRFPPVALVARMLPKALHAGTSSARHIGRWLHVLRSLPPGGELRGSRPAEGGSTALPDDADRSVTADPVLPGGPRAGDTTRGNGGGRARRRVLRRRMRLPRPGALAFLHRHGGTPDRPTLPAEEPEGEGARRKPLHH